MLLNNFRYLVLSFCLLQSQLGHADDMVRKGEYIFRAAGCAACHTDRKNKGEFLAGGRAIKTPFGTLYSPNITPDKQYGIGSWSDADFIRALTEGVSPQGKHYYPAFPYTSYTHIKREDLLALKAYLFSVKPVAKKNREHEMAWYANRFGLGFWKWLNFTPGEFKASADKDIAWNRGAYLVTAMSHCAECHTPRGPLGGLKMEQLFTGTADGPEGEKAPNITPDKKTGIGRWSKDELFQFLKYGETPDGDYTGGLMAEVVDEGLSHLTDADIKTMITYLQSLPAREHELKKK